MVTKYKMAPEVAEPLIGSVARHEPLRDVRIEYVFRDKAPRSKGRIRLGCARKVSGLAALWNMSPRPSMLTQPDPFFVIEISHDTWLRLSPEHRMALVDHELCHCRVAEDDDGRPVLGIVGHDVEEFSCIIERHGLWGSGLAAMGSAVAEQLALAVDEVTTYVASLDEERGGSSDGDESPEGSS